jgi:hypothetical protein
MPVALEDLYTSATKKMKVTRKVHDPATNSVQDESKILEINLMPHWKPGTKINFPEVRYFLLFEFSSFIMQLSQRSTLPCFHRFVQEGDRLPGVVPADITFILEEKPHPRFTRDGDNLVHKRTVNLEDALCGTRVQVMTLDNRQLTVDCSHDVISPGFHKVVRGEGMPLKGRVGSKGDLIIEFNVLFPKGPLSAAQKQKVKELRLF